jgi:hypothetical protein
MYRETETEWRKSLMKNAAAMVLTFAFIGSASLCFAEEPEPSSSSLADALATVYRTPLAGEQYNSELFGHTINVPARSRDDVRALDLGASTFFPRIDSDDAIPIAAFYWTRYRPSSRTRAVVAIFDNELDAAWRSGEWELLAHAENDTSPFPQAEIIRGREDKGTSLVWGTASAWLGAGYRVPVAPFQADNDLRLQLYYHGGYLYSNTTRDTRPGVSQPGETYLHGINFRVRYDGLRRNIMELPHIGMALGADLEWTRRDKWGDANYGGTTFKGADTRDYTKYSAYGLAALPVPLMSEKNRLIASIYGGFTPNHQDLDRFSAFRLGGGPFPTESEDLWRHPYPGATFNQFPVSDYLIGTMEYRRELLFFLYLHLRGTFLWANGNVISTTTKEHFNKEFGKALSVGLTSGFAWNSQIYLEYSHDTGLLRNGVAGDSMLLMWSKNL